MGDFVVGDKIKGVNDSYGVTNRLMELAEVLEIFDDGDMNIKIIRHMDKDEEGSTYIVHNDTKYFQLVEGALSFNFAIDDEELKKWFEAPMTFINTDEDSLDAWRYALADIKTIDEYLKNEEENEMKNEVLELWFKRKGNDIEKKYDELEIKYIDEKYSVVKSYEDMIEDFERQLEDLYKYNNANEQFVLKENNSCNVFKYVLDEDKLVEEAEQFYKEDKKKEMQEVLKEYNEIKALLSMSEDLEYQQSVLIEYGIIDKKTKRMI